MPDYSQATLIQNLSILVEAYNQQSIDPAKHVPPLDPAGLCVALSLQFNAAKQQGKEKELFEKIAKINQLTTETISQLLSKNPTLARELLIFAKELADAQGFGKTKDTATKTQSAKKAARFHNYAECSVVIPEDADIPDAYVGGETTDAQETYLTHLLQKMSNAKMFRDGTYVDITSAGHRTTVTCKNGEYYFYDSNNPEAPQIVCQTLAELAEQILDSYFTVLQDTINAEELNDYNYILNFEAMQHESKQIYQKDPSMFSKILHVQQEDGVDLGQNTAIGETLLLSACEYGQVVGIKELLNINVPHIGHYSGFYPLHRAVYDNNMDVLNAFISSDIDFSVTDKEGMTALHIAAAYGFSETCLRLLQKAPEANKPDSAGYSPLHLAAQRNQTSTINILSNYDPSSINITENEGRTALQVAAHYGNNNAVEVLLNYTGDNIDHQDNAGSTALHLAAEYNEKECIDSLLRHGADPSIKNQAGWSAVHIAAAQGNNSTLIKFGQLASTHIDVKGGKYQQTPLFNAVICKNIASADILLSYGADPNYEDAKGYTPAVYAVAAKNKNMVDCLVLHGAQINESIENRTYNNSDAAQGLLEKMLHAISYLKSTSENNLNKAACRRPLAYINTLLEPNSSLHKILTKHVGAEQIHHLERQVVGYVNNSPTLQAVVNEGHFENIKDIANPSLGFRQ